VGGFLFFFFEIARSIVSQGLWDRWWLLLLRASCSSARGLSNLVEEGRREGKRGRKSKTITKNNNNLASRIMDG